jgi:dynein regulatory complex protein 1
MSEDIDLLIAGMKAQFGEMREHYDQQLQAIEADFDRERLAILERNKAEVEHLFEEHKKVENDYL